LSLFVIAILSPSDHQHGKSIQGKTHCRSVKSRLNWHSATHENIRRTICAVPRFPVKPPRASNPLSFWTSIRDTRIIRMVRQGQGRSHIQDFVGVPSFVAIPKRFEEYMLLLSELKRSPRRDQGCMVGEWGRWDWKKMKGFRVDGAQL
jgi:hypothetical protein